MSGESLTSPHNEILAKSTIIGNAKSPRDRNEGARTGGGEDATPVYDYDLSTKQEINE